MYNHCSDDGTYGIVVRVVALLQVAVGPIPLFLLLTKLYVPSILWLLCRFLNERSVWQYHKKIILFPTIFPIEQIDPGWWHVFYEPQSIPHVIDITIPFSISKNTSISIPESGIDIDVFSHQWIRRNYVRIRSLFIACYILNST